MNIRELLLGRRDLKTAEQIVEIVRSSTNFDQSEEGLEEALLIFQTSKQQTWLIATTERLYCVLDDISRGFTRTQWSMTKKTIVCNNKIILPISTRDKTDQTGLLDLGKHRGWLFTKRLFASSPIDEQVKKLIKKKMLS
jgi:hypothetical protein